MAHSTSATIRRLGVPHPAAGLQQHALPALLPVLLLAATAALALRAPAGAGALAWGLALSFTGFYGGLALQAARGDLMPQWLGRLARPLFSAWSRHLNRPLVVTFRGRHHFFLSYGLLQALGAALFGLHFQFYLGSAFPQVDALAMALFSLLPMLGGNRLAGLLVQVFVERLPWREALFKVRFLSVGFAAGMVLAIGAAAWFWEVPVAAITDAAFTGVLWAQVLGSLGCVYYGCCHGPVRSDGLGLEYAHPALKPNRTLGAARVCVTPTPLYCALYGAWILAFALALRTPAGLPLGLPTALAGGCFGLGRFAEEWFRADAAQRPTVLNMNQLYAVSLVVLSAGLGLAAPAELSWPALGLAEVWESLREPRAYLLPSGLFAVVGVIYSYHRGSIGAWR